MTQARTSAGQNFQDNILGTLRDRSQPVTFYLKSRLSVRGKVMDFDPYVVLVQPLDGGPPYREGERAPYRGDRPPYREGGDGPGYRSDRPPYREGGDRPTWRDESDRPPNRYGSRPPSGERDSGPSGAPDRDNQPTDRR